MSTPDATLPAELHSSVERWLERFGETDHVDALTQRFMVFGGMCREAIAKAGDQGDEDTADLFTEISRVVDKDAWFIGAHNA